MQEGITREVFESDKEAIAFTEGLDYVESDHVSYEGPILDSNGQWVVEVRVFA